MTNIKNIINTKASHLFVAFCSSLQSLSSLSSFSSGQKSFKNLRPPLLTFLIKQALIQRLRRRACGGFGRSWLPGFRRG